MASLYDTTVVQGMSAIGDKLEKLMAGAQIKIASKAMKAAAGVGLAAIQTETPVRTGNLYRHLKVARRTRGVEPSQVTYIVYVKTAGRSARQGTFKRQKGSSTPSMPDPYYWFFVEFGTSRMAANPFLLRGFLKSAGNAATTARDEAAYQLQALMA